MSQLFGDIQPVIKKETGRVAVYTIIGCIIMWIGCAILHIGMPEQVPLDYTVFLGGIAGGIIAVLNFFLMGLTVQKVAATADEDTARSRMKASYSQRMMLQILWIILAIVAPCFWFVTGILPLLFPSLGIKAAGVLRKQ